MVTEATAASRAEVDTSRPFQSVREAVEVFGERQHADGNCSSNGRNAATAAAASPSSVMLECLKKLEEELAEAKGEVVELRQRQAQMEVAMSSLSVQFSKGLAVYSSLSKGKEVAIIGAGETMTVVAMAASAATGGRRAAGPRSGWRASSTCRACRRRWQSRWLTMTWATGGRRGRCRRRARASSSLPVPAGPRSTRAAGSRCHWLGACCAPRKPSPEGDGDL